MDISHTLVAASRVTMTALLLLGLAQAAGAQSSSERNAPAEPPAPGADVQVDVSKLPINMARIERRLRQTAIREEHDGLNLRYFVDVYARAPQIELFTKQDNLLNGPVPYGGPTHREILNVITPQEHRAPAADFGALFRWLSGKAKK